MWEIAPNVITYFKIINFYLFLKKLNFLCIEPGAGNCTRNTNMEKSFRLAASIIIVFGCTLTISQQSMVDVQKSVEGGPVGLGCNMRLYTYRITQSDSKGTFFDIRKIFTTENYLLIRSRMLGSRKCLVLFWAL